MPLQLDEIAPLLDPTPLPLELGYERLPDGVLHVAVRTDLHGCTGEQFEWWFRWRCDTQQYVWWHPVDHISSTWRDAREGTHVGSTHVVEERFTGLPAEQLSIQFRDPEEFFDPDQFAKARETGAVTAAVLGRVGLSWDPPRADDGAVVGGRLLHLGRDTPWGCALRSHFFLGQDLPGMGMDRDEVERAFPDEFGRALLMHCYNEFTFLSRFLPSLFIGEHRDVREVALPW
jgi:hypothetical protein